MIKSFFRFYMIKHFHGAVGFSIVMNSWAFGSSVMCDELTLFVNIGPLQVWLSWPFDKRVYYWNFFDCRLEFLFDIEEWGVEVYLTDIDFGFQVGPFRLTWFYRKS
jgi:hypothetical protein